MLSSRGSFSGTVKFPPFELAIAEQSNQEWPPPRPDVALPFSESEKLLQSPPYIYTSGTVPVNERDADYVFYQSWTDARAEQKNVDVLSFTVQFNDKPVSMDSRIK